MSGPRVPGGDLLAVSDAVIEPARLLDHVADPAAGASVLFLGTVRDHSVGHQGVTRLEYEAYPEVVERHISDLISSVRERWTLVRVAVLHRTGSLDVGDVAVGVAVSAAHRSDAFSAGAALIDELKASAPIWKKEHWPGGAEWVAGG